MSGTLSSLALTAAGLELVLAPEPLKRIALANVVYRKLAGRAPKLELVMISRHDGAWGPIRWYLEVCGEGVA